MRRTARWGLALAMVALVLTAIGVWSLKMAAGRVPEFYRRALAADLARLKAGGERFERQALELHNALHHPGRWQVRFTEDEINGWLGATLPAKFPDALPRAVSQPRVALSEGRLDVAGRCWWRGAEAVVSLRGEAYLTNQPGEIALRLEQARFGALPLPLTEYREAVSSQAERLGAAVRWTEDGGMPIAVIRWPPSLTANAKHRLVIEELEIGQGALIVAGRTEQAAPPATVASAEQPAAPGGHSASETRQR